jgi:hypothetical protein
MTHGQMISRALTWLRGQSYPLVLAGIASCDEIPDAIGFATNRSAVVEVKCSKSDFHRDRKKYKYFQCSDGHRIWIKAPLRQRKQAEEEGAPIANAPNMGTQRWFLSEPGIVTAEMVAEYCPDHGLLHICGKVVKRVVPAPMRSPSDVDLAGEAKYLQYALRHLVDNLGRAGVRIDLIQATKMFGHEAVDIADWKKKNLHREAV